MKIVLINVSARLSSDGSRLISALLKRAGHRVTSVFLARPEPLYYEQHELEQLHDLIKECELVMVAVYSSYAIRAIQVTEFVHKKYPGMTVIWGGPHCISVPELGLRYADGVCFSEGDQVIVDLVNKMESGIDYLSTPNMAFNVNETRIVNNVLPPFSDLDSLPYYDYELDEQFLLDRELCRMTKQELKDRLAGYPYYIPILYVLTSRGCPHQCAYCNNCRYVAMFGRNTMRFQTVDHVIDELVYTLGHLDFVSFIGFGDDDFFMRPTEQLEDFAKKYKAKVGLPFGIAISANTYRTEKMEILLDSGLKAVQIGVQSGSQRIIDAVYNRKIKVSKTKAVIQQAAHYHKKAKLDLLVDFIIDNPYETKQDIIQTYRFLIDLPFHVKINLFFLAFFPGTPIYNRPLDDGIIGPYNEKAFRFYTRASLRYQKNYETFLILLARRLRERFPLTKYLPKILLRVLGTYPLSIIASIFPGSVYAFLSKLVQ